MFNTKYQDKTNIIKRKFALKIVTQSCQTILFENTFCNQFFYCKLCIKGPYQFLNGFMQLYRICMSYSSKLVLNNVNIKSLFTHAPYGYEHMSPSPTGTVYKKALYILLYFHFVIQYRCQINMFVKSVKMHCFNVYLFHGTNQIN